MSPGDPSQIAHDIDFEPAQALDRHEVTPRQLIVYLRELAPARPLVITYQLKAAVAADVVAAPARVYQYYDPSQQGHSKASRLTVTAPASKPDRP